MSYFNITCLKTNHLHWEESFFRQYLLLPLLLRHEWPQCPIVIFPRKTLPVLPPLDFLLLWLRFCSRESGWKNHYVNTLRKTKNSVANFTTLIKICQMFQKTSNSACKVGNTVDVNQLTDSTMYWKRKGEALRLSTGQSK